MREIFCDVEVIQSFDVLNKTMILKEIDTNQEILIGGIPVDSLLLKLDVEKREYKRKSMYLKRDTPFIHKGCDYCLIIPSQEKIILFELKSLKPKEKDYVNQFIASEIFIEYCSKLSNHINCSEINYTFQRILLSPKYNIGFTSTTRIQDISTSDKCGNPIEIRTPGFPNRIRLEKLIK
ncbi:hypothetical protein [Flavobacterium psychrophilum]|uniref:hypothetical protein n=1 Tax=Flavobacterium psychrophilum TaxID=96345 RepID=UPI000B7C1B83|nr:hypothetical protein [Flavobacterium psychrophilum]SNB03390.1 hypothetical protein FPC831_2240002 [Flavobacterium psychrophilum]